MGEYLKENLAFLLLLIAWIVLGIYFGSVTFGLIGISIIAMMSKERYAEILLGFWLILMLSDSHYNMFDFAKDFKPAYMSIMVFIVVVHRSKIAQGDNMIFQLFLPFFIWSCLIIFDSPDLSTAIQKTLSYAFLFYSIPSITRFLMKEKQTQSLRTFYFIIMIYLVVGLILKYTHPEFATLVGRFRGIMGNPNGLGVLALMIGLLFDTIFNKVPGQFSRQEKIFFWLVIFANLLLSQSRSALFALMLYFFFSNFKILKGFIGALVFISILFSYQFVMNNLPFVIESLGLQEFFRLDTLEGGSGRVIAWTFAWEQIQENFFIGRGFNYAEWIYAQNYNLLSNMGHQGNAHNSYLTFWLDTGLIGLVLYVVAFLLMFLRISKSYVNSIPFMYAVIFSVSFESWLTASLNPFTIALLLGVSIMLYAQEEVPETR
jgi:O-antigen ligase